jgi:uridine kinase
MPYSLTRINEAIRRDPAAFAAECDAAFAKKVESAARKIAEYRGESRVILLSGPSGSGKTTTALKIEEQLDSMGIETHTISIDNYFNTIDPATAPRNRAGEIDYESPFCLDIDLLCRHFSLLDRGNTIHVPKYEFSRQMRSNIHAHPLRLGENELAIFEGIHALNDIIVGRNPKAFKLYIAARSNLVDDDGDIVFNHAWLRLCRRIVRDDQFRGNDVEATLKMWPDVRRGEKLYISPFKNRADVIFDSSLPYEVSVMRNYAVPLLSAVPEENERHDELMELIAAFGYFEPIDPDLVAKNSLLREFIGGGSYKYH